MRDDNGSDDERENAVEESGTQEAASPAADAEDMGSSYEESITEELAALIDDGRTYAQAEIAFQKTRAAIAGKSIGLAVAFVLVALILVHIAFLALAVGLVMALEPLVTIWGAIAIVVGVLLIATGALGLAAKRNADRLKLLFSSEKTE